MKSREPGLDHLNLDILKALNPYLCVSFGFTVADHVPIQLPCRRSKSAVSEMSDSDRFGGAAKFVITIGR